MKAAGSSRRTGHKTAKSAPTARRTRSEPRAKKQWILSVSPKIWHAITKKHAYATSTKPEICRIGKGDNLVFYVHGTGKFNCIYRVDSGWHEPCGKWPVRVTDEIDLSVIRDGIVGVRSVAPLLEFAKKSKWIGLYLHGGIGNHGRAITSDDCDVISKAMYASPNLLSM